jgi:hypothetical protein
MENRVRKKENIHAFFGRFDIEHKLQCLLKLLHGNQKKIKNDHREISTLKLLPKLERENLFCILTVTHGAIQI